MFEICPKCTEKRKDRTSGRDDLVPTGVKVTVGMLYERPVVSGRNLVDLSHLEIFAFDFDLFHRLEYRHRQDECRQARRFQWYLLPGPL